MVFQYAVVKKAWLDIHYHARSLKFDNAPEGAVGHGKTIDEELIDTLNYFIEIVKENYPIEKYPNGLLEENIVYSEFSDF